MSTTVLLRGNDTSVTYQNTGLSSILASLEAVKSQHIEVNGIGFVRIGAGRLLLMDLDTTWCRSLLEVYSITHDLTNNFELKFIAANVDFDLDGALNSAGYVFHTPVGS